MIPNTVIPKEHKNIIIKTVIDFVANNSDLVSILLIMIEAQFTLVCLLCLGTKLVICIFISTGVIYSMWASRKPHVNEEKCNCDCFDTIFKGMYISYLYLGRNVFY